MRSASLFALLFFISQTSCVVVGGYSSEGGWYVWPWGVVISVVFVVLLLLFSRRRR